MPITALPSAPQRTDTPQTFVTKSDAFVAALAQFQAEANLLQADVNTKQANALTYQNNANTYMQNAQAAQTAALASANAVAWNAGTNYALNACAVSQIDFQTYRRVIAGTTATDPKNDTTNWTRVNYAFYNVKQSLAANNIDLKTGDFFTKTITGATVFTVSNVPVSGLVGSFILEITNGGQYSVTWWSNLTFPTTGFPFALTASGRDVLGFYTHNGGATWTCLLIAKDVK